MSSIPPFNPVAPTEIRNRLSKDGAMATAREIVEIWREHGHYNVTADVEPIIDPRTCRPRGYYAVKTNLIDGLPPR